MSKQESQQQQLAQDGIVPLGNGGRSSSGGSGGSGGGSRHSYNKGHSDYAVLQNVEV
jgi:hypothetical protein